jgi:glyoxylase-like metal-dependent hydrolase (beta-lactamase superfamily II)
MRRFVLLVVSAVVLSAALPAQDARAVIAEASRAMGVTKVDSITLAGTAAYGNFGQSRTLSFGLESTQIRNYNLTLDFVRGISHAIGDASPPGAPNGVPPGRFDEMITTASPGIRQLEIWTTPWGFLRGAAAAARLTLSTRKVDGVDYRLVEWQAPFASASRQPYRIVGYISPAGTIAKVETWIDHPLMGDLQVMFTYTGYTDAGGVKVPVRVTQRNIGMEVYVANFGFAAVNPDDLEELLTPAAPPRRTVSPSPVVSERLADGVYLLTGGYDALAVELEDSSVILGGGGDEARGFALLAETKRLFPGKRVRHAVSLHGHFDHAMVLPAFASEGIPILADDQNRYFLQESLLIPRTLVGDALAKSKKKPVVEGIPEKRVLGGDKRRVELHHLKRIPHADGMLAAWLPQEKILFVSDIPLPVAGIDADPSLRALLQNVERLGLDFEVIIGNGRAPSAPMAKAEFLARVKPGP